jgi:prophage regulatory protein
VFIMKNNVSQKVLTGQAQFKLIKIGEVSNLTTISKSHLYTLARQGKFPKARKLTENSSVWLESEVIDWMQKRLGIELGECA